MKAARLVDSTSLIEHTVGQRGTKGDLVSHASWNMVLVMAHGTLVHNASCSYGLLRHATLLSCTVVDIFCI